MAFKEVSSLEADTTISLGGFNKKTGKANPTKVEGYFLGKKEVSSPRSKTGKSSLYILQTAKGNVGVWGKTDLDRKMGSVVPGTMIRVTQNGTRPTPNGDMYTYKVEYDDSNRVEVPEASATSALSSSEDYSPEEAPSMDEWDETNSESVGTFEQEDVAQAQAVAALERKAKMEAILKKGKK